jgi:hypothetical protein
VAYDEDQTIQFLEAIGEGDAIEIFRLGAQSDALDWMRRTLKLGSAVGLSGEDAAPIIFETLDAIRGIASARTARGRA